jgi:hypothetical protein
VNTKIPPGHVKLYVPSAGQYHEHFVEEKRCILRVANIEARSRNRWCRGKQCVTHSECASVASVIQQAKRMRRIILSPVSCLLYHIYPR